MRMALIVLAAVLAFGEQTATALANTSLAPEVPILAAAFFQNHPWVVEFALVTLVLICGIFLMASSSTTERIEVQHRDFWNTPLGSSWTHVRVPKEPSGCAEIIGGIAVFVVIYLVLRFTCLFGFFTEFYAIVGSFLDMVWGWFH